MWTLQNLLRLAHSNACAQLSDQARSSATTHADGSWRGGEIIELAQRLVATAEDVLLLAVAVQRARRLSWEAIGESLGGVSKQAAQKRFSERVEELEFDVLLAPLGQPAISDVRTTTIVGPDAVIDPDATLARLDAWALRHHERTDDGEDVMDHLVSHGLHERPARTLDHVAVVSRLSGLLAEVKYRGRELPAATGGCVRGRLLEAKAAVYDAMGAEPTADHVSTREQTFHSFRELTDEAQELLSIRWTSDDEAVITMGDRPVAILRRTMHEAALRGWWLHRVEDRGYVDHSRGAWKHFMEEMGRSGEKPEHLEHRALLVIANMIGSDQAKGIGPFAPGGIAGPGIEHDAPETGAELE